MTFATRRLLRHGLRCVALAVAIPLGLFCAPACATQTPAGTMVSHYYQSILRRASDPGGQAFWEAEAARMGSLGASVNETWYAMAMSFFSSGEYVAFHRNDHDFVADLYQTFFSRAPDADGLAYWSAQLAAGMPREVVLAAFMFSPEFAGFTQAIFGNTAARPEVNTVVDFYRGILSRLPDTGGFNFWVQQFRSAQCQGAAAVYAQVESISSQFTAAPEYSVRARSNAQYVGDLYNAFLRRGGDLQGVQFWIHELDSGARTRDAVRQAFIASPEFSARVTAIISQGCGGAPINALSVSSAAPVPLTPLTIVAAGIDSNSPMKVTFTGASGYAASGSPIGASADGTVVVAVPLYIDPSTHQLGSGAVAVRIQQGGVTSSPVSITIQNLPTVASYGVTPGRISHVLLALHARAVTAHINQLQMYDIASNGAAGTASRESGLFALQSAVIQARDDVDRVTLSSSTSIDGGTVADGAHVHFNSTSLDLMDRTAAVFLSQIFSNPAAAQSLTKSQKSIPTMSQILTLLEGAVKATPDASDGLDSLWDAEKNCPGHVSSMGCVTEAAAATGGGFGYLSEMTETLGDAHITGEDQILSARLGLVGAAFSIWSLVGQEYAAHTLSDGEAGHAPDTLELYAGIIGGVAAVAAMPVLLPVLGAGAVATIGASSTVVSLSAFLLQQYEKNVEAQYESADEQLATGNYLFQSARMKGHTSISNSQGVAAAQTGLELCGFGPQRLLCIDGLADTSGNYQLHVPIGMPGTDYSGLTLSAYDPVTDNTLGSEVVDLRGLNPSGPVSVPTISGSCIDTDATNPDGDDPDCD